MLEEKNRKRGISDPGAGLRCRRKARSAGRDGRGKPRPYENRPKSPTASQKWWSKAQALRVAMGRESLEPAECLERVRLRVAGERIFTVVLPLSRIARDIQADGIEIRRRADDVFVIVSLPEGARTMKHEVYGNGG